MATDQITQSVAYDLVLKLEADRYPNEGQTTSNSRTFTFKVTIDKTEPCVSVAADVITDEEISYVIGESALELPLVESAVPTCEHSTFTVGLKDGSTVPDIFTTNIDQSVKQVLISLQVTNSEELAEWDEKR